MIGVNLTEKEFGVLNYLDIFKSVEGTDPFQVSTGLKPERITSILGGFVKKGYAEKEVSEEGETWKITPIGEKFAKSYRESVLAQTGQREAIIKKCEEFEELNVKLKELVTKWQVKIVNGILIPNDHIDSEYDSSVLDRIFNLHEKVVKNFEELASIVPMYKNYIGRLNFAVKKLKEDVFDYMIKDENSYHNVWFELHESILKLWGKERVE